MYMHSLDAVEDSLHRWPTSIPALPIPKFCSFHQKKNSLFSFPRT